MKVYDVMMSSTSNVVLDYLKYNHNELYIKHIICLDKVLKNESFDKNLLSEVVALKNEMAEVVKKEDRKLFQYSFLYTIDKHVQSYLNDYHFRDCLQNDNYFIFDSIKLYTNEVNELLTSDFLRTDKHKINRLTRKGKSLSKLLSDLYKAFQEEFTPNVEVEDEDIW